MAVRVRSKEATRVGDCTWTIDGALRAKESVRGMSARERDGDIATHVYAAERRKFASLVFCATTCIFMHVLKIIVNFKADFYNKSLCREDYFFLILLYLDNVY